MYNTIREKLRLYWERFVNRETITYVIAGVLTTAVNYIAYYLFCNVLEIQNLVANVIAWVIAVVFAYIINDLWVFQLKKTGYKQEIAKIFKFFGARLFSLAVEEAGLYIFVDMIGWNNLIVKAFLAVIVIAMNYIFSKIFIFNKKNI